MPPSEAEDIGKHRLYLLKAQCASIQKEIVTTPHQHFACSCCLSGVHLQEFGTKISTNQWSTHFQLMFLEVEY